MIFNHAAIDALFARNRLLGLQILVLLISVEFYCALYVHWLSLLDLLQVFLSFFAEFQTLKFVFLKFLVLFLNTLVLIFLKFALCLFKFSRLLSVTSFHLTKSDKLPLSLHVLSFLFLLSKSSYEHFYWILRALMWTTSLIKTATSTHVWRSILAISNIDTALTVHKHHR